MKILEKKHNYKLFYFLSIFIFILYFSIFALSYLKVINFWSFSQAHVNYFEGYVRRGLFGTIMLLFEHWFGISTRTFFSSFFLILYSMNIVIFLKLAKQYSESSILIFFIILSPTLVLFPFNDLGGYARFDIISIVLLLLHSFFVNFFLSKKITLNNYIIKLKFLLIPILAVSLLIHEIQIFTLPFHFLLTLGVMNNNYFKTFKYYLFLLPFILLILFVHAEPLTLDLMIKGLEKRGVWNDAILIQSQKPTLDLYIYGLQTNILNFYNLKYHILMIALAVVPFLLIYNYFKKKIIISTKHIQNENYFIFFSLFPLLFGLLVGDFGRWVNLMAYVSFAFLAQFPIQKKLNLNFISYKDISTFISCMLILFIVIYFVFFVRIPHCCNLEQKNITLSGGMVNKIIAIVKTATKISNDSDYNLDKRFLN